MEMEVECASCGTKGKVDFGFEPETALCEFCYLNLKSRETIDGQNRFFLQG